MKIHSLEIRLLLNEKKKISPKNSQLRQVFLNFFTKTVTYLESNFDFTNWKKFWVYNLELPLCLQIIFAEKKFNLWWMTSNLFYGVLNTMDMLHTNNLCVNL